MCGWKFRLPPNNKSTDEPNLQLILKPNVLFYPLINKLQYNLNWFLQPIHKLKAKMKKAPDISPSYIDLVLIIMTRHLSSLSCWTLYSICLIMADHTQLKLDIRKWKLKLPKMLLKCHQNTKAYHRPTLLFRRCTFCFTFLIAKAVI